MNLCRTLNVSHELFNDGPRRLGQDQVLRIFWLTLVSPVTFVRLNNEWAGLPPATSSDRCICIQEGDASLGLLWKEFIPAALFTLQIFGNRSDQTWPIPNLQWIIWWERNSLGYQKCDFVQGRWHICLWRKERHKPSHHWQHILEWCRSLTSSKLMLPHATGGHNLGNLCVLYALDGVT